MEKETSVDDARLRQDDSSRDYPNDQQSISGRGIWVGGRGDICKSHHVNDIEVPDAARQVQVRGKVDKVIEPVVELCKTLQKNMCMLEVLNEVC